jgi:hypothetical protein
MDPHAAAGNDKYFYQYFNAAFAQDDGHKEKAKKYLFKRGSNERLHVVVAT